MNINATLFVQAGNFLIAYFLFQHILLKVGYQALCEKQRHHDSLEDMVTRDKRIIEAERQRQKDAWTQFRSWCRGYCPRGVSKILFFRGITTSLTFSVISESHKKKLSTKFTNTLMASIKGRYER